MPRIFTLILLASAFAAGASQAAAESIDPYDPTYASASTLRLPAFGAMSRIVDRCEIVSGGALAVAGRFGGSSRHSSRRVMGLATALVEDFDTTQPRTSKAGWRGHKIPRGHSVLASDFAVNGSLAYATAPIGDVITKVDVFRTRRDGHRAKSFDRDGHAVLRVDQRSRVTFVRVKAMGDRGILVAIGYVDGTMDVVRLSATGRKYRGWASGGVLTVPAVILVNPDQEWIAFETLGGGLMIGAGDGSVSIDHRRSGLLMLAPDGSPFETFGDRGYWFPPSNGKYFTGVPYTFAGNSLEARANPDSSFSVLYMDYKGNDPFATQYHFHVAWINAIGQTVWNSPIAGETHYNESNEIPNSFPLGFAHSDVGSDVFAYGLSYYGRDTGTLGGGAVRWDGGAEQASSIRPFTRLSPFVVDDFEATSDGRYVYACGSIGRTSSRTKPPWQRKRVAIRRIKL